MIANVDGFSFLINLRTSLHIKESREIPAELITRASIVHTYRQVREHLIVKHPVRIQSGQTRACAQNSVHWRQHEESIGG